MKVMQVLASFFLVISGTVLVLSIAVIPFPYLIKPINAYLANFSNVISYFSVVFAALALLYNCA